MTSILDMVQGYVQAETAKAQEALDLAIIHHRHLLGAYKDAERAAELCEVQDADLPNEETDWLGRSPEAIKAWDTANVAYDLVGLAVEEVAKQMRAYKAVVNH